MRLSEDIMFLTSALRCCHKGGKGAYEVGVDWAEADWAVAGLLPGTPSNQLPNMFDCITAVFIAGIPEL